MLVGTHVLAQATSPPPSANLIFSDTFDSDNDDFVAPWYSIEHWDSIDRANPNELTTDASVVRKGTQSAKFEVHEGDIYPLTFDSKPRAQLTKSGLFCEGDEDYVGWSTLFPKNFPREIPPDGWLIVAEHGFGPPWRYPPMSFVVRDGTDTKLVLSDGKDDGYATLWSAPITYGSWMDIVMHVKWSSSDRIGFVELWLDGQRQTFANGQQRIYINTLKRNATGCGSAILQNYRAPGMFDLVTLYHDEMKVGNSYGAVAP